VSRFIGKRRTAGMVAIMVACIAAVSAYAFTASNTVSAHTAGAGAEAQELVESSPEDPAHDRVGVHVDPLLDEVAIPAERLGVDTTKSHGRRLRALHVRRPGRRARR